jgi:hypothetical protein
MHHEALLQVGRTYAVKIEARQDQEAREEEEDSGILRGPLRLFRFKLFRFKTSDSDSGEQEEEEEFFHNLNF